MLVQDCMAAVGDPCAAIMLNQIVYWYTPIKAGLQKGQPKLRVCKGDIWWIAKSYSEWQIETGLTYEQARRCVRKLMRLGVIETRVVKFNGSPTVHMRLLAANGAQMLKDVKAADLLTVQNHSSICAETHMDMCDNTYGYVQEHISLTETTAKTTTEIKNGEAKLSPENQGDKSGMKTAEEILKNREEAKKTKNGDKEKKRAASHWRDRVKDSGAKFQIPLSMADLGMFKRLEKDLGDQVCLAIDYAFDKWWKFSQEVKGKDGLEVVPAEPALWFVLRYRQILGELLVQSIAAAKVSATPPPVAKPAAFEATIVSSKPLKEVAPKLTWEALQEALAELEAK